MGAFKEPHGGELKNLYLDEAAAEAEKQAAATTRRGISPTVSSATSSYC